MSLATSARSFLRRVRRDGPQAILPMVRDKCMTLLHREALRQENARRQAEENAYQAWLPLHTAPDPSPFSTEKTLSFLIPTWNAQSGHLSALGEALLAQTCPRWEACLLDGASARTESREALRALAARDPRFIVQFSGQNEGISGNTNAAYRMSMGEVVALCDHDDLPAPDAVRCILEAAEGGADFIYTDEDKTSADGHRFFDPHLKADFAPDTLRAGNYICHITALSRSLAEQLIRRDGSLLRGEFDGSQDHDLALRATELAQKIVHIPRILYHWRMVESSFSHRKAEKCVDAACRAVRSQLERLGIPAQVRMENLRVRIRYTTPLAAVTAIVWGEGRAPALPQGTEILRVEGPADFSAAARKASGDYLLFLYAPLRPLEKGPWLQELLMYAQRPNVGCVGSGILDRQRFYRHGGYAVTPEGVTTHHAGQWLYGRPYMITDRLVRNVTGVSSALLLIRRETFLGVGGFGEYETDLRGADLGLRCLQAGLVNVYTPHGRMVCKGDVPCLTAAPPAEDLARFHAAWGATPTERYYSPLFTPDGRMAVRMNDTPAQSTCQTSRHPKE